MPMKTQLTLLAIMASTVAVAQNTSPFPATGNVGIGTTTPFNLLHIQDNKGAGGNRTFLNIENLNNTNLSAGASRISAGTGTNQAWTQVSVAAKSYTGQSNGNNVRGGSSCLIASDDLWIISGVNKVGTGGKISFFTDRIGGNYQERAFFDGAGKFELRSQSLSNEIFAISDYTTNNEVFQVLGDGTSSIGGTVNTEVQLNVVTKKKVGFCVNNTQAADYQYGIKSVINRDLTKAIAVSDSRNDQDVFRVFGNGAIEAYSLRLSKTIWADHVFDEDYPLMPLDELEQFVKENHHLPHVPDEKEVEKEGIDVVKTDALLLEKIEELSLYVIELNKELNALKKKNEALEEKLNALDSSNQ